MENAGGVTGYVAGGFLGVIDGNEGFGCVDICLFRII